VALFKKEAVGRFHDDSRSTESPLTIPSLPGKRDGVREDLIIALTKEDNVR